MASTATTRLRLEKQGTGDNENSWGVKLNTTGLDLIDSAIAGFASYTLSGSKTLTSNNYAADEARMPVQNITGGTGGTITIPAVEKTYLIRNGSTGSITVTTGGGTTASVPSGDVAWVACDGTNVILARSSDYGSTLVKSTGTPSSNSDLTNKQYVDTAILNAALSASLPSQSGNAGKVLSTDGTNASWSTIGQSQITDALGYTPTSVTGLTGVQSVANFKTGLTLVKADVGLGNASNTSDADKPISTATQTALNAKAATGAVGSSGLTMSTARVLGRTTASTGAIEELSSANLSTFLSLGSLATASSINNGNWSGTDLSVANGGTGASDAAGARTNLGLDTGVVNIVIDGSGQVIPTGVRPDFEWPPFAATITGWSLLADQSGSIVVDLFKDTYANYPPVVGDKITASAPPTISGATKAQSNTLTGWTTSIAAGDIIRPNVNSASTITRVTLAIRYTRA